MARPSSPGPLSPQPHEHRSPARRGRRGTPRSPPRAARPPEAQARRSARGRPSLPSILSVAPLVGPDRSDSSASTRRLLGASPGAPYRAGCLPAPARISFWSPGVLGPIITAPPRQPRQHPAQDAARSPRLHGNRLAPPPAAGTLRPGDARPRRGVEGTRGEQTGLTREEGPLRQVRHLRPVRGPRQTTGGASFSGDPRRPLSEEASQARGAGGEAGQEGRVAQGFCQGEGAGHATDTGAGNETLLGSRNLRKTGKETEQRRTSKTA